jgi:5,10-methylenetetrahydrofolate reductase
MTRPKPVKSIKIVNAIKNNGDRNILLTRGTPEYV